jgi:hypothetical protein
VGTSSSSSVSEAGRAAGVLLSAASVTTCTGSFSRPDCKHNTCYCHNVRSTGTPKVGVDHAMAWAVSPWPVTAESIWTVPWLRQLVPGLSLHSPS